MYTVRPAGSEDFTVLRRLVAELHEHVRHYDASLPVADAIIDAYFAYLVSRTRDTGGRFLLARDQDGSAIGYACVFGRVPPDEPDEGSEPHAYVADLYVTPGHRRRGVGRRLMAEAERFARGNGVPKIELSVLAGNEAAVRFYRGLGYDVRILRLTRRLGAAD